MTLPPAVNSTLEYIPDAGLAAHMSLPVPDQLPMVALVWRRRWWTAKVTCAGLVLGAVVVFLLPQRYESTVQLMPPDPQAFAGSAMLGLMASGSSVGTVGLANSILSGKTPSSQLVGILESRTVKDSLIDHFDLRRAYRRRYYAGARRQLANRTEISEDRKTGIITITVTDTDPHRARDLAQAYVEQLNKEVARVSTSSARRERIFLEERLKLVEKDVHEGSRELSEFSSRHATLDPQAQGKAVFEGAARLQGELIAAESELRGLETIYSGNNTRVISLRARIAELRRQMQKMAGSRGQMGDELEGEGMYPSLRQLPMLGMTYLDLYRRVKVQEAVYEALMKQEELAKVQEAKEIPTISVLDAPLVPERGSFPPRLLFTLLSGCLAFLFALAWIAFDQELKKNGVDRATALLKPETWQRLIPGFAAGNAL